ncbi:MAG: hypothetical protein WC593_15130 [Methanoregula sp.]
MTRTFEEKLSAYWEQVKLDILTCHQRRMTGRFSFHIDFREGGIGEPEIDIKQKLKKLIDK